MSPKRNQPNAAQPKRSRAKDPSHKWFPIDFLDGLDVGVAHLTTDGSLLYANPQFGELFGFPTYRRIENFKLKLKLKLKLKQMISPQSWPAFDEALGRAAAETQVGELQVKVGAEHTKVIRITLGPVGLDKSRTILATATEVTALIEAEEGLREREQKLQQLTTRILQTQDIERRRIARDLHDVTAQELVAVSMSLSSFMNHEDPQSSEARASMAQAIDLLHKIQDEIRTLSYVLHPPLLDEMGLGSALGWYLDGFKKRSGIDVRLDMPVRPPRLPLEKETALFRVVQEGLTNVVRHSQSSKAILSVRVDGDHIILALQDEGKGIEPRKLEQQDAQYAGFGVGIPGMRERLKQYGGTLELQSGAHGTTLTARLPMAALNAQMPSKKSAETERGEESSADIAKKRILIADDHEVARRGIRSLLADESDLEICAEATDGFDAVNKAVQMVPDLCILDLSMPRVGGLAAAQHIRAAGISTKILIFSTHNYPGIEAGIRAAGCEGFIPKTKAGQYLLKGVRAVLRGDTFYAADVPSAAAATAHAD